MEESRVFITGIDNFDIVFVPGRNEVISVFKRVADSELQLDNDDYPAAS
jgi:hypothetical protein